MRKLIEQYRRKPDLDVEACTPITLADGVAWYFPRPWLELRPIFRDGKAAAHSRMLTCGAELDVLIESIGQADPGLEQAMAILSLGALLLLRNYDVEDSELGRLFILRPGDPASDQLLRDIIDVGTGHAAAALGPGAVTDPKA